ncbi:MOSC domain-containing protein, partial [Streptomyces diastatochromogenes]|uniref:MOSC domain-containing protein n=1 Tax=Streptomyces diastatochromogenes TaxID=42236 RepID=UPI0036AFA400
MGNAELQSIHVHPVKAFRGVTPREAVVEPWGLAGDRRWALIDDGGKVVTQREQPRLALAAAEPVPGGGVLLSAPGLEPLTVAVPEPTATVPSEGNGTIVEAVSATDAAADRSCGIVGGV